MELELKNVSIKKGSNFILQDISFKISQNDFIAIIGPNGGGKTTLLKCILGVLYPSSGEILFNNKKIGRKDISTIGYVPQINYRTQLFPISVIDVVMMGRLRFKKFWKYNREDKIFVSRILEQVGLSNMANRTVTELSGGERQRVFIARALATEPSILLLDEPTSNVDSMFETKFLSVLKDLKIPILMVTHDVGVVSSMIDRVLCLNVVLYSHDSGELNDADLDKAYNCPIDIISHGKIPHRVLKEHGGHNHDK